MELKEALLNYRKEHGLSQRKFAEKCDLSNSLISLLEMGVNPQTGKKPNPDTETYKKIAKGMDISVHELFEQLGDSEMVDLTTPARVLIRDSDLILKIFKELTTEEYYTVMEILNNAEKRLKEKNKL